MHPAPPTPCSGRTLADAHPHKRRSRVSPDESGATSSLELMALTPLLALLVLFVLWAGNSAHAGLVADLAAKEAAAAAAVCCDSAALGAGDDVALRREHTAAAVLGSRPGLDSLCLRGPQPDEDAGYVTETEISFAEAPAETRSAGGARLIEVHHRCETDGAVAPLRGLFPTLTMSGRATHVTVLADPPSEPEQ